MNVYSQLISELHESNFTKLSQPSCENIARHSAKDTPQKYCSTLYCSSTEVFASADKLAVRIANELCEICKAAHINASDILVAGIGNANVAPDSLGPICASMISTTENLKTVIPRVQSDSGIECADHLKALTDFFGPSLVIAIDALASSDVKKLFSTVQLSAYGITPGSGTDNSRQDITHETLGVPVIAIGVPTVIHRECYLTLCECEIAVKGIAAVLADAITKFADICRNSQRIS